MSHCQIGKNDPDEPESTEPELASEPEESLFMTPVRREAEAKEPKEVPLEPLDPEEESHGVTVVVVTVKVAIAVGPKVVAAEERAMRVNATNVLMAVQRVNCKSCRNTGSCNC